MIGVTMALLLAGRYPTDQAVRAGATSAPVSDGMVTVRIEVDARSGPWSAAANPSMPFGSGDAAPPARVTGFDADRDQKITIVPAGSTTADRRTVGSAGILDQTADDLGSGRAVYPSFYAPKLLYPIRRHALMAVFADDKGRVLGRPFPVGTGVRVPIPSGAAALQLGFNDLGFAGNGGTLQVIVRMPEP